MLATFWEAKTFDDEEVSESREERQKLLQQAGAACEAHGSRFCLSWAPMSDGWHRFLSGGLGEVFAVSFSHPADVLKALAASRKLWRLGPGAPAALWRRRPQGAHGARW